MHTTNSLITPVIIETYWIDGSDFSLASRAPLLTKEAATRVSDYKPSSEEAKCSSERLKHEEFAAN